MKRYDMTDDMADEAGQYTYSRSRNLVETDGGDWCLYEDVEAAIAKAERERDLHRQLYRRAEDAGDEARKERDTARQQLAAMKERAEQAEAELKDGAMRRAFDKIADSVCPGWEYPGQVVRAVITEDES